MGCELILVVWGNAPRRNSLKALLNKQHTQHKPQIHPKSTLNQVWMDEIRSHHFTMVDTKKIVGFYRGIESCQGFGKVTWPSTLEAMCCQVEFSFGTILGWRGRFAGWVL